MMRANRTSKDKSGPVHRNLAHLHSKTNEDKAAQRVSAAAVDKNNFRSQSKPTMGEKTTEDDSSQVHMDSGPPSPVDEEGEFE